MVQVAGHKGWVTFAGTISTGESGWKTNAWTLDLVGETADVTDFTSAGWEEFLALQKNWSGTVDLFVDSTKRIMPSDVGTKAALALFLSDINWGTGGQYLSGNAVMTGWHPSVSVDGVSVQTLDFQGTSVLGET